MNPGAPVAALAWVLLLCGCAAPLPAYIWIDYETALEALSERARSVRTLSATGTIVLGRTEDSAVHLEGAMVSELPGKLHVRAWKFGHTAFDLTLTPEGLWILTGEDAPADADASLSGLTSERFSEAWGVFTGDFFASADREITDTGGKAFTVSRPWGSSGVRVTAVVDRRTLTVTRYQVVDANGLERQSLDLDRYREIGGIPWPLRITARGESGLLVLDMDDAELNSELPPAAFRPPARAVKRQ